MTEIIDLSNPDVLRMLATQDDSSTSESPTSFLSEFLQENGDSDIEMDEEEFFAVRRRNIPPTIRQPFDIEELDNNDDGNNGEGWREGTVIPDNLPFIGRTGLLVDVGGDTPLDYFSMMVDDSMITNLVEETNRYAGQTLRGKTPSPRSRFQQWVEVTVGEMRAFLGLIVAMGLIVIIENMAEYWSLHDQYRLPFFSSVMVKDRFLLILSFFHVADNERQAPKDDPGYDPIYKIRTWVEALNRNFGRTFSPGKNIAIDEAMVAWRGPLSFRVYNPDKPDKFGIKVFELCDSNTAYCCKLYFYVGKRQSSPRGATFDVVKGLIAPYLDCGPPKEMLPKLKKGDKTVTTLTDGTLNYIRFMDRKEVRILTTAHAANSVLTGKTNPVTKEPVIKFAAVHNYNKYMGAVDRSDQMVACNAFKRRTLKWWKKAFFHLFMLSVQNAYIVHKATAVKKLSHRIFRRDLAAQLVQFIFTPVARPLGLGQSSLFRLTARHFPRMIQPKPNAKRQNPQRECVICSERPKREFSRFECQDCDVGLHVDRCFELYHTKKDFKRAYKRTFEQSNE
ncbi:PiggyBac transposable element-derived protein 4-like [Plakobranchus ocellatus]|uniref:PiggyBac transposable element-derived protein 4-like n=1 Tax=Plakobranchus ocellatus TaxID=259542 RepID=A0AAV4B6I6_9GAST|nr:PiggyBac transposable element-derived protein 4-like [Plakobranchus ocellatus]